MNVSAQIFRAASSVVGLPPPLGKVARYLQNETGLSIKRIIRALRPLQDVQIELAGHPVTATPQLSDEARTILDALTH